MNSIEIRKDEKLLENTEPMLQLTQESLQESDLSLLTSSIIAKYDSLSSRQKQHVRLKVKAL